MWLGSKSVQSLNTLDEFEPLILPMSRQMPISVCFATLRLCMLILIARHNSRHRYIGEVVAENNKLHS